MKSYGQSAGYAEQALTAIKVVHTYGQELLELKNYTKYLDRAQVTSHKQSLAMKVLGHQLQASSLIKQLSFSGGGSVHGGSTHQHPLRKKSSSLSSSSTSWCLSLSIAFSSLCSRLACM